MKLPEFKTVRFIEYRYDIFHGKIYESASYYEHAAHLVERIGQLIDQCPDIEEELIAACNKQLVTWDRG